MKLFKKVAICLLIFLGLLAPKNAQASDFKLDKAVAESLIELRGLLKDSSDVKQSSVYISSSAEKRKAYDDAIAKGQAIFAGKINEESQFEVKKKSDQTCLEIRKTRNELDGTPLRTSELVKAIEDRFNVKKSKGYSFASDKQKKAYNDAIAQGQAVLDKGNIASQDEVSKAILKINAAIKDMADSYKDEQGLKEKLQEALDKLKTSKNSLIYIKKAAPNFVKKTEKTYNALLKRVEDQIVKIEKILEKF